MKKIIIGLMAAGMIGGVLAGSGVAEQAAAPAAPAAAAAPAAPAGPKYGKNVGDVAKPVVVKDFGGKDVDTAKLLADKKTMIVIVNSVCNLCAAEVNALAEHKDKFTAKAAVVLVVVDQNLDRAKSKYDQFAKDFTMLHDPDFKIGTSVDLTSTPSTLIIDKEGKIVFKGQGFQPDGMKEYLAALK